MSRTWTSISLIALLALGAGTALGPSTARAQDIPPEDQDLVDAYDVMQGVTMGLLGTTALLGSFQLYNLPTTFGDGACAQNEDSAIFGSYACDRSLSLVHGMLAIATLSSYTATGVLALAAPNRHEGIEDAVTDVLGVAHAVGIGLTGVLGLIGAFPRVLGLHGEAANELSRVLRVIHFGLALFTAGTFAAHLLVDQID
jgi:hypothetical protein